MLIKRTGGNYYISKKVILPYTSSSQFKKYFPELYELYEDDTLFKEDLEKLNFEKLFLGTPTNVSLSKDDIKYLCETFGVKVKEDKLNDISVYKITTPQGIFYYDKKVISILKEYKGGLKIIRGLAGTGKTITLLQFVLYKTPELRKELKKVGIFCFNKPLSEYLKNWFDEFHLSNLVEIRRIKKNIKEHEYSSLFYFPENEFKYILIDEFQDFPNNIGYFIINKHKNVIIFVDETQKIYDEGFTTWKEVLKDKFKPGLLNNYLRIVYRNPTDIYKCGLELLSQDSKLKGYIKVQEILKNSKPINETGGLAFYSNLNSVIKEIRYSFSEIKKNTGYIPKIGFLINGSEKDENKYKLKFSDYFGGLDFDVKSYLRVKGLEYDLVVLEDFWKFLSYYKNNFSFLYRMVYTIISRGKFGVIIPYPHSTNDIELKKVYDILLKHSKNQSLEDLVNEIYTNISKKVEENNERNKFDIPVNLGKLSYKGIEIIANLMTIFHGG